MFTCVAHASAQKLTVEVPAQQVVEIDYPTYEHYVATLRNGASESVDVAVLSKDSDEQIRGFGLSKMGKAAVDVEQGNRLVIKNSGTQTVQVKISISEQAPPAPMPKGTYITFTLRNNSAKSIPLIIPTVMNPNLSPMSNSGVSLKVGQEILFRANGKKHVLLTVDSSIKEGDVVEVSRLLKQRKKELGI